MFSSSATPSTRARSLSSPPADEKVEVIALEGNQFIDPTQYARVTGQEQTTIDWIRNQDTIYLNGVSLRAIVDNLKKERLKACLRDFLYTDKTTGAFQRHLDAVKALFEQFFATTEACVHLTAESEFDISDAWALRLAQHLHVIFYDLEIRQKEGKPLYQFPNTPAMQALRAVITHLKKYFSTDGIDISCGILEKILREYLLVDLPHEQQKQAFLDYIFQYGHHGGFLYALLSAHMHHLNKEDYLIPSEICMKEARTELCCDDKQICLHERVPIVCLMSANNPEVVRVSPLAPHQHLMMTEIRQVIQLGADGLAKLAVASATNYSCHPVAREILTGFWFRRKSLCENYAKSYILHGHYVEALMEVSRHFPDIVGPLTPRQLLFKPDDSSSPGEKVLAHLGLLAPSFAEYLLAKLADYAGMGTIPYLRALHVMYSMGRLDIIQKALLPYLVHTDQADDFLSLVTRPNFNEIVLAGYNYLVQHTYLPEPGSEGDIPTLSPQKSQRAI